MKRSEIQVGEAYYYDRATDWHQHDSGRKVIVVADGAWKVPAVWSRDFTPYRVANGNGVLVDIHHQDETVYRDVVPVSQLRGPYEETLAAQRAVAEANRQAQLAARDAREAARDAADELIARAAKLGYEVDGAGDPRLLEIDINMFRQMLDALDGVKAGNDE
jgi:hypothetical protein